MSWLQLEGKAAIVTGGALGIGRACCEALASHGARTVVADVDEKAGAELADELKAHGGQALFVKVDVTRRDSVEAMVSQTVKACGGVDILVNNAGILIPRLIVDPAGREELTEAIFDRMMAVNVKGFFLCAQAVAREMIRGRRGGVIVNMSSESGLEGSEGQSVYAATKAAGYSVTRSWAKELGRHGIRVVGLAPGILEATALRSPEYERAVAYTRGLTVEQFRAKYEQVSIPLGRPGRLREVADAVCFLASDRASYVHGTVLNVSGGKSRG
ncbi:MAG: glucose 1-dehydrogenase [Lentisphaerae bacterium]|nr:glucose 1-dehydrogenase [Lentisphaerota bacterium]